MSIEIEENKGRIAKNRGLCSDRERGANKKQKKEKKRAKKGCFF